jgi:hypothetical protein
MPLDYAFRHIVSRLQLSKSQNPLNFFKTEKKAKIVPSFYRKYKIKFIPETACKYAVYLTYSDFGFNLEPHSKLQFAKFQREGLPEIRKR